MLTLERKGDPWCEADERALVALVHGGGSLAARPKSSASRPEGSSAPCCVAPMGRSHIRGAAGARSLMQTAVAHHGSEEVAGIV